MKPLLVLAAAAALFAAPLSKSGLDAERLARIPVRMKAFVEAGVIPGAVTLIARHGQIAHLEATGWADIEHRKPMRTDTIFQIMSMTKPFTGVAIMMLAEDGGLSVNDPVEKYLPEFRNQMMRDSGAIRRPSRPITIRDLMTHTSGMSGPHGEVKNVLQTMDRTLGEAVTAYAKEPLEFEPGSKWMYSNTGIATLGRILEVVSDKPFEQFISERIIAPLGMKDTFIFPPPEKTPRIAVVYTTKEGKLVPSGPSTLAGDSRLYRKGAKYSGPEYGLYSTATDLFAFYQMMLNNGTYNGRRYLSKAAVHAMTRVHTGDLKAGHLPGTGFGLTWEVIKDPIGLVTLLSPGTFGHGGAFGTHGWIDREKDLVGVFLVQRSGDEAKNAMFQMTAAAVFD